MADPSDTPWLDETLAEARALNDFVGDRAMRGFQSRLLNERRGLEVVSPFTGRPAPLAGIWISGGGMMLRFEEGGRFSLTASELRLGYPLTSLTLQGRQVPVFGKAVDPLSRNLLEQGIYDAEAPAGFDPGAIPRVISGAANFAHFIWNEYPALRYLRPDRTRGLRTSVLFDSLGLLTRQMESLGAETETCDYARQVAGWQKGPASFLGATYCNAEAKAELLAGLGLAGLDRPPPGPPRFYLTIRNQGRTLDDQAAFLGTLSRRLLETWPDSRIVLDGFSLPEDFDRRIYDGLRPAFRPRIDEGKAIAAAAVAALPPEQRGRVRDITGARMTAALREAASCHYYVAHSGTTQHKIAWFFPRPGCVHCNRESITPASLQWLTSQVHDTLLPFSPDPALVENIDRIDMPNKVVRNRDYRILDHEAYAGAILADIRTTLAI